MLSRALWTGLLALLAWIPIGRAESHAARADRGERALYVVSALDIATDSPARIGDSRELPRQITTDREPAPPRALSRHSSDGEQTLSSRRPSRHLASHAQPTGWRGYQSERLTAPHDATAPPPQFR